MFFLPRLSLALILKHVFGSFSSFVIFLPKPISCLYQPNFIASLPRARLFLKRQHHTRSSSGSWGRLCFICRITPPRYLPAALHLSVTAPSCKCPVLPAMLESWLDGGLDGVPPSSQFTLRRRRTALSLASRLGGYALPAGPAFLPARFSEALVRGWHFYPFVEAAASYTLDLSPVPDVCCPLILAPF